jgi:hypothetical protein
VAPTQPCPAADSPAGSSHIGGWPTRPSRTPRPLCSARITRLHRSYEAVRPCALHRYSTSDCFSSSRISLRRPGGYAASDRPGWLGGHPEASHLRQSDRFPSSTPEPKPRSRHLHAGHRLGSKQVAPRLFPRHRADLGFAVVDGFSTRHQWFTCVRLRGSRLAHWWCAFSLLLTTPALDRRSVGWFGTSPCRAVPEDLPPSPMQQAPVRFDTLIAPFLCVMA